MKSEDQQTPATRTRRSKASIKLKYECLMQWRKENNIVCKPPAPEKDSRKDSLKFELDLLTKPKNRKR